LAINCGWQKTLNPVPFPMGSRSLQILWIPFGLKPFYPSFDDSLTGFGNLYNYYAVVDPRNLCPTGWHVPTGADWNTLFESQGGWNIAGLKLKDNTTAWGSSILTSQGSSGFRAIPAGLKESSGALRLVNKFGYWWAKPTGSESPTAVWINNLSLEAFTGASGAQQGLSVRCVKD